MGLFDLFSRKKEGVSFPPAVALSLATLTERHKNAAKSIFSPKERTGAQDLLMKLSEARRALHQAESAAKIRDFEFAFENIDNARKNVQVYIEGIKAFPALQPLQPEAGEIQQSIEKVSTQVLMSRV